MKRLEIDHSKNFHLAVYANNDGGNNINSLNICARQLNINS